MRHAFKKRPYRRGGGLRGPGTAGLAVVGTALVVLVSAAGGCSDPHATADKLMVAGDLAGAEAGYEEILAEHPGDLPALSGLAVVLMLEGKHDEAMPIQEQVIAADPTDVRTRVELGFNYLNYQGRPEDAVGVFREAVAIEGTAKNMAFLAQAQVAAGMAGDAEKTLRGAVDCEPGYPHSYALLVGLLEQQQRYDEAGEVRRLAASRGVDIEDGRPAE